MERQDSNRRVDAQAKTAALEAESMGKGDYQASAACVRRWVADDEDEADGVVVRTWTE
jgi:hypothetical protein